ncbi:Uncharacterized protein TCM_019215 [Theobroma cacao]|uniref:RNase H type-1 domain-containing protein n=1 Tax=Theobroma cacao TaxID=3641 RepID=A0A061EH39_THECC|nr:Uncharacterized protein TCM_019215 [Theobroma cacao]
MEGVWLRQVFPRMYSLALNKEGSIKDFGKRIGEKWRWKIQLRSFCRVAIGQTGRVERIPGPARIERALRDPNGAIKLLFSKVVGVMDANTIELLATKETFMIFAASKWKEMNMVEIENDSSNAVTWLDNLDKSPRRLRKIILGIEELKRQIGAWEVRKVPRSVNEMVDDLAKGRVERSEDFLWVAN